MQSSARKTEAAILAVRSSGNVAGDPKPSDFEESVARYALQYGKRAAATYRAQCEASFKISRALKRGNVATLSMQCALAHANGFVALFARLYADLLRLVRSEAIALGVINSARSIFVYCAKTDVWTALEHSDVELMLAQGRTHTVDAALGEWSEGALLATTEHPNALRLGA